VTGVKVAKDRVMGTAAVSLLSAQAGANCVRVHDVKATKEILDMYYGIYQSRWICLFLIGMH
jgi:dihydropteroate synthase